MQGIKRLEALANNKKAILAAYGLIFAVAVFLRLFKLPLVPYGLHADEASAAYEAWCLANYGVSRDLVSWPVYFSNFGGGQNVLYSYVLAGFIRLFGHSTFVIRLPGVLFSLANVFFGTLIAREGFADGTLPGGEANPGGPSSPGGKTSHNEKAGLTTAALLAILPCFIMQGRFGLESLLHLGAATTGLYLLIRAVRLQKKGWFCLAGLWMGLTLYTYAVSYLVTVLFLLLAFAYLLYTGRVRLGQLVCFFLPLAAVAWPLVLMVAVNTFGWPSIHIGAFTIPSIPGYRGGEIHPGSILTNLPAVLENAFFQDGLAYNALPGHFTLYIVSIPFAIKGFERALLGLGQDLKSRRYSITSVVFLFLCSVLATGLLLGDSGPNINKLNAMYFAWAYMVVLGIRHLYRAVNRKRLFAGVVAGLYLASFLAFSYQYYFVYPAATYPQHLFFPEMDDTARQLEQLNPEEKPVVFTGDTVSSLYYALACGVSPHDVEFEHGKFSRYQNHHFGWDGTVQKDTLYVAWNADGKSIDALEGAGLEPLYLGAYRIYGAAAGP